MKVERKAYLIQWSEGEPTLALATDFSNAIEMFCVDMADDENDTDQVKSWIESVTLIAESVLSQPIDY